MKKILGALSIVFLSIFLSACGHVDFPAGKAYMTTYPGVSVS